MLPESFEAFFAEGGGINMFWNRFYRCSIIFYGDEDDGYNIIIDHGYNWLCHCILKYVVGWCFLCVVALILFFVR